MEIIGCEMRNSNFENEKELFLTNLIVEAQNMHPPIARSCNRCKCLWLEFVVNSPGNFLSIKCWVLASQFEQEKSTLNVSKRMYFEANLRKTKFNISRRIERKKKQPSFKHLSTKILKLWPVRKGLKDQGK